MTKVVTTEIVEESTAPETTEDKATDLQAEIVEENKEQTEENKEETKAAAELATQAAKVSKEESEKAQKATSYNEYALKGLMDSVSLVVTRMEQVMSIVKEMKEDFQEVTEELRVTTELHQEQIATIDEAANKVVTATAALVKLHKQMVQIEA